VTALRYQRFSIPSDYMFQVFTVRWDDLRCSSILLLGAFFSLRFSRFAAHGSEISRYRARLFSYLVHSCWVISISCRYLERFLCLGRVDVHDGGAGAGAQGPGTGKVLIVIAGIPYLRHSDVVSCQESKAEKEMMSKSSEYVRRGGSDRFGVGLVP
jgi:hypothetical protein